jgi:hypothetical protein
MARTKNNGGEEEEEEQKRVDWVRLLYPPTSDAAVAVVSLAGRFEPRRATHKYKTYT